MFDFTFKDLLNQTNDDWINNNIIDTIHDKVSDHIGKQVAHHTDQAEIANIKTKVKTLGIYLIESDLPNGKKRIFNNDSLDCLKRIGDKLLGQGQKKPLMSCLKS